MVISELVFEFINYCDWVCGYVGCFGWVDLVILDVFGIIFDGNG